MRLADSGTQNDGTAHWRQCLTLLKPVASAYKIYIAGTFVRQILAVLGGYSLVWLLRQVSPGSANPLFVLIAVLVAFDAGVAVLDQMLGMLFVSRVSLPMFRSIRLSTLRQVLAMPLQWQQRQNAVELVSKLNTGSGKVVQTAETLGRELLPAVIRTLLSLGPLIWLSAATTPLVLGALLVFLWLTARENGKRQPYRAVRHEQYARDAGTFTECVQNFQALQQFGQVKRTISRYEGTQQRIIDEAVSEMTIAQRYLSGRAILISVTRRMCQGIWLWQYQSGRLDAPMVMYLSYLTDELIGSFATYAGVLERVYDGVEPARTVTGLLAENATSGETGEAVAGVRSSVSIEMRDVHFAYDGGPPVLRGVNLCVAPGEVLGIVGSSGIGKTTLQHLLSRMLDTDRGEVLVDGRNIRTWSREQLRGVFATVSQQGGILFSHQTILETIRFARPSATVEEVFEAARTACIEDEIRRLPGGFETLIGPGGVQLSKGQQQRIGIAQALLALRDRKVLILDEFTSALDSRTEQRIIDNLRPYLAGKTVVIVAHRLATLRKLADRIVVLDRTGVVEEGAHGDLVAQGGRYAELARLQSVA